MGVQSERDQSRERVHIRLSVVHREGGRLRFDRARLQLLLARSLAGRQGIRPCTRRSGPARLGAPSAVVTMKCGSITYGALRPPRDHRAQW